MTCEFDWSGPVSWALIIFGWLVVNAQHNSRETRKEIRAALNDLYEILNGIEDDAFAYHTGHGDPALSRRIKRCLGQIYPRIILAFMGTIKFQCAREVANFRQAVTLDNFDTATRRSLSPTDTIFESLSTAKETLVNRIERAFLSHYRK